MMAETMGMAQLLQLVLFCAMREMMPCSMVICACTAGWLFLSSKVNSVNAFCWLITVRSIGSGLSYRVFDETGYVVVNVVIDIGAGDIARVVGGDVVGEAVAVFSVDAEERVGAFGGLLLIAVFQTVDIDAHNAFAELVGPLNLVTHPLARRGGGANQHHDAGAHGHLRINPTTDSGFALAVDLLPVVIAEGGVARDLAHRADLRGPPVVLVVLETKEYLSHRCCLFL